MTVPGDPSLAPSTASSRTLSRRTRALVDGPSRVDRESLSLVRSLGDSLLPRAWSRVPRYEDLVEEEVVRIREEHGESAFAAVTGGSAPHPPLLERRHVYGQGEIVALSGHADRALAGRHLPRGFRRRMKDSDGTEREYFIRDFGSGARRVELRIACPSVSCTSRESDRLHGAGRILERVLLEVGRTGDNPVRLAVAELRLLAGLDRDHDCGLRRLLCLLRRLTEIRFEMNLRCGTRARSFGVVVAAVVHVPGGPGGRGDGDIYVEVSDMFVGCLRVFATEKSPEQPRQRYDWNRKLERGAMKRLGAGYARFPSALTPHYAVASGLEAMEARLLSVIDEQMTLALPVHAGGELRRFDGSFCPLLGDGQFAGALGNFRRSPRSGFTMFGTGSRSGGLLGMLGIEDPGRERPRARTALARRLFELLRHVVVELEGGVVAVKVHGRWLTLADAAGLPLTSLLGAKIFMFVPLNFVERRHRVIESYAIRRADGAPPSIRVTTDERHGERVDAGEPRVATDDDGPGLGERLLATRQRLRKSRAAVGADLGVSHTTIANWERGRCEDPSGRVYGKRMSGFHAEAVSKWLGVHEQIDGPQVAAQAVRETGTGTVRGD